MSLAVILLQRTRAVWGNTRTVTIVLLTWATINAIPELLLTFYFMESIRCMHIARLEIAYSFGLNVSMQSPHSLPDTPIVSSHLEIDC